MNKLTKIGLSALCGSLASVVTAHAGALDVTGSATATWTTKDGEVTGNPIGMATGMTFTGNGELDGGQTFTVAITHTNQAAFSVADITLNTNSSGKFVLAQATGGQGIGGYDDNMPRAWEEVWDIGIATNANFQKGVGSSTNISWTSPKVAATTLQVAYAPDNDGAANNNKTTSGATNDQMNAGIDVVLDIDAQGDNGGVNLFLGASRTKLETERGTVLENFHGNHEEAVVGLEFTFGPLQAGGQISAERLRAAHAAGAVEFYGNSSWGVAFNVNDDLSISYSEARHVQTKTKAVNAGSVGGDTAAQVSVRDNPKSWMKGDSIQVAYTIGGIGIKFADTKYDNTAYTYDNKVAKQAKVFAVSLAF